MRRPHLVRLGLVACALFACSSSSKDENDRIAACNASGGRWTTGGCDSGRCERPNGATPDDDEDDLEPTVTPDAAAGQGHRRD